MKYIKLVGYGNQKSHLIPVKSIACFSEEDKHTSVRLINGTTINVIENMHTIEEILELAGASFYDEVDIVEKVGGDDTWDVIYSDNDDLPF